MASRPSTSATDPTPPSSTDTGPESPAPHPVVDTSSNSSTSQPWREEFRRANPSLAELSQAMKIAASQNVATPTLRVNQLDAIISDLELYEILRMQFFKSFTFFDDGFIEKWKPELDAMLKAVIFQISIGLRNYSYGQQLQNLTFPQLSRTKKALFLCLSVVLPYLLQRWFVLYSFLVKTLRGESPPDHPDPATLRRIHSFEKLYQLLNTLNFLVFLWNGSYVTLLHRILGIRQVYLKRQTVRYVGFEYMNRQLIWNGFTEFMLFIMPMVPITRIARTAKRLTTAALHLLRMSPPAYNTLQSDETICPICQSTIAIPYETNCGHKYCYYCGKVAIMSERNPPCNICGTSIITFKRHQPS